MKIERFKAKNPTIMLTPMLDMFTMILIFLITAYAPEETKIKKSENIHLPMSMAKLTKIPHIQIEVTKDYVKVNGTSVTGLIPETGNSESWSVLKAHLSQLDKAEKKEPVLLLADKETSFRWIDRTVAYVAAAGYGSVYLVTETGKEKKP